MSAASNGPRRLYRSRDDRMIAGVCAGLAAYLNVDVTVVRIIAVITIVLPGPSVIAYLIGWLLIPEQPPADEQPAPWAP
jgi:phage shock protein C